MKGVKNMNRLKELRQEKKLSQKELAENIGVSLSNSSKFGKMKKAKSNQKKQNN